MRIRLSVVTSFLFLFATVSFSVLAEGSADTSSVEAKNEAETQKLLKQIAGKEKLPAEKVFKNVKVLRGMSAEHFVNVMNNGYSRSLGVGCEHCHVAEDWAADEKRPKLAAREMITFAKEVNAKLRTLEHLDTNEPVVNCATCHRGSLEPATTVGGQH